MTSSPTRPLAAALTAVLLVLAGCGDDDDTVETTATTVEAAAQPATTLAPVADDDPDAAAAVVGGTEITNARLAEEQEAAAAFADANPDVGAGFAPGDDGTFPIETTRFLLGELIQGELLATADAEVTDADRAEAERLVEGLESAPWLERFVERQATLNALSRRAAEAQGVAATPEAWFEAHRDELVCARHLLVASEEEASAARDRVVDGGEDFGAVAGEVSTDEGSAARGGELGCAPASLFVPEFAAATLGQPLGEVGEPVETQFGWHVIVVDERGDSVEFEEAREAAELGFQNEMAAVISTTRAGLLEGAEIEVAPAYGVWDPTSLSIVDPATLAPPAPDQPAPEDPDS